MDLTRHFIREDAALFLSRLTEAPAWTLEQLEQIRHQAELARRELHHARLEAEPKEAAVPDTPGALAFCDFCGSTVGLTNDGIDGGPQEWHCASIRACIARRAERFPLRESDRLRLARVQDSYWSQTALAGAAALTVYLAHQDTGLRLTGPRLPAHSRPRPPAPDPWAWTEGARFARLHGTVRER
jgi:hypothetical protein